MPLNPSPEPRNGALNKELTHHMDDRLDQSLTPRELHRLEQAELIRHGRQAIQESRYRRAASLLREASRRAPLRGDLRELLGTAIEGMAIQKSRPAAAPAPAPAPKAASPEASSPPPPAPAPPPPAPP